jgi:hypothetical protein
MNVSVLTFSGRNGDVDMGLGATIVRSTQTAGTVVD